MRYPDLNLKIVASSCCCALIFAFVEDVLPIHWCQISHVRVSNNLACSLDEYCSFTCCCLGNHFSNLHQCEASRHIKVIHLWTSFFFFLHLRISLSTARLSQMVTRGWSTSLEVQPFDFVPLWLAETAAAGWETWEGIISLLLPESSLSSAYRRLWGVFGANFPPKRDAHAVALIRLYLTLSPECWHCCKGLYSANIKPDLSVLLLLLTGYRQLSSWCWCSTYSTTVTSQSCSLWPI